MLNATATHAKTWQCALFSAPAALATYRDDMNVICVECSTIALYVLSDVICCVVPIELIKALQRCNVAPSLRLARARQAGASGCCLLLPTHD